MKKMLCMNILALVAFIPLCTCDVPYLLRTFPSESGVLPRGSARGPCVEPTKRLSFLQGADEASLENQQCVYESGESMLICKLGLQNASETIELDSYPLNDIKVALEELAICGYTPPITQAANRSTLHILDVPALAIFASKVRTLLISGVNLWQAVELRQFRSLKHLAIVQGDTYQMQYYHSPHCADCTRAHPPSSSSFHYLLPLSKRINYYYFASPYAYEPCAYDLLKHIRANPGKISTFIVESSRFPEDADKPICQTCASGLCPVLAACLDDTTKPPRRKKDKPFECLCVEDLDVENEFEPCDPLTLHQPMYSTRCNHTPSFWTYVTQSMIILSAYILASIIVFIISTIFLCKSE